MADGAVIIGAGLAGLSAAYHLKKGFEVFEADTTPGGLLQTKELGGYKFDRTGHLLHLKDAYVRGLVQGLLKGNLKEHARNSAIYSKGVFSGYPFQANTYGLPGEAARECVEGFMSAPGRAAGAAAPGNFRDWILHYMGEGIARHFMLPYNAKLWRYPLEEMSVEGIAPYVPIPTVDDIRRGATREGAEGLGYNAKFFYPERGGIYSLVEAFLPFVRQLSLGQKAVEVDTDRRTVAFDTGYTVWYDSLISTMPLPELMKIIKDVPPDIREAAEKLRYVSVYDISLGVARERVSPYHWVYFPEGAFPFYRAGFLDNFSPDVAPAGCSALYVEVSHIPGDDTTPDALVESVVAGLIKSGVLRGEDEVPVRDVYDIKYGYVVFDAHLKTALPAITGWLASKGIRSIGRYGAWEYSGMEDAILEGRAAAEAVSR
ncbi:MAG: FAD-dependent oxidoreductase [Nitrospirae bacterium]|nr:FAD-dependent oxidoreductase [Nitrospirota bacterium]